MDTVTHHIRTIDLGHDQLMIFDSAPRERVRVLCGATWLTQEGEVGDAFLQPGTELPLRAGRTLIEALEPTRVQILSTPGRGKGWLRARVRRARHWITRQQLGPVLPELMA